MTAQSVPDTLEVSFLDDTPPAKVLMTFGLLSKLAVFVGEIQHLPEMHSDYELQQVLFREVLSVRDNTGTIVKEYKFDQPQMAISVEMAMTLIEWIEGHLTDFFMKRLQATLRLQEKLKTQRA